MVVIATIIVVIGVLMPFVPMAVLIGQTRDSERHDHCRTSHNHLYLFSSCVSPKNSYQNRTCN
jgi:hypothetical protein